MELRLTSGRPGTKLGSARFAAATASILSAEFLAAMSTTESLLAIPASMAAPMMTLRAVALAVDFFHDAIDFAHGQVFAARQADQYSVGPGECAAFIQQRVRQQFFNNFTGPRRTGSFDKCERAFGMAVANKPAQIVKMNLNQAGTRQQLPNAAYAPR